MSFELLLHGIICYLSVTFSTAALLHCLSFLLEARDVQELISNIGSYRPVASIRITISWAQLSLAFHDLYPLHFLYKKFLHS